MISLRTVYNSDVYPQILAVLLATISSISDGMQYAWTAPTVPLLLSGHGPFKVTNADVDWLETSYMLGALCALPLTIYLLNRIGRKYSLLASAAVTVIAWAIIGWSSRIEYIFAARFLTGMSSDINYVAGPTYIAEVAQKNIRGFLSSIFMFMVLIGILLVYTVTPFVPLYVPCIIAIVIGGFELVTFPFMPESPYYYLYKNQPDKAMRSLKWLRRNNDVEVEEEFKEIASTVEKQRSETGQWRDVFFEKSNRKALIIAVFLNGSQHMCSKSVILMNLHLILEEAGTKQISASTSAITFAGIMLLSTFIASLTLDNFGRKKPLVISTFFSGVCLAIFAIFFTVKSHTSIDLSELSWVPSVTIFFYAAIFQMGLGLVPTVIAAEMFPANVKGVGMTLTDTSYVAMSFISLQIYHWTKHFYGIEVPFYIFMCWCFGTVLFTIIYVPETKGQSLDQIQVTLKGVTGEHSAVNRSNRSEQGNAGTSFGTFTLTDSDR